ncbi:hypothetical protein AAHH78_35290, partial [Burkholderia pseudomallei]
EPRRPTRERHALRVVRRATPRGRELNVSADIDRLVVHEDDGETAGAARRPITGHYILTLFDRRMIGEQSEGTAEGYVFRVVMRLR